LLCLQELLSMCIAPSGPALTAVLSGDSLQAKHAHHSAKRQYAAAELLTSSVPQLLDALVCGRPPPLERLWDALRYTRSGHLDPLAAGRIARVLASVLAARGDEVLQHLRATSERASTENRGASRTGSAPGGALSALVRHVSLQPIADLFVRLLDPPDPQEGDADQAGGWGLARNTDEERVGGSSPSAASEAPRASVLELLAGSDIIQALTSSAMAPYAPPYTRYAASGPDLQLREETIAASLAVVLAMTRRLLFLDTLGVAVPPAIFVYAGGSATSALASALDVALIAEEEGHPLPLRRLLLSMRDLIEVTVPPPPVEIDGYGGGLGGGGASGSAMGGGRGGGGGAMGGRSRNMPRFAGAGRQAYGSRFRASARGRPLTGGGRPAGGAAAYGYEAVGTSAGASKHPVPVSPASAMANADADSIPGVVDQIVDDIDDDAVANVCVSAAAAASGDAGLGLYAHPGGPSAHDVQMSPTDPVVSLAQLEGVLLSRLPRVLKLLTRRLRLANTATIPVPAGSVGLTLSPTPSADSVLGLTAMGVAELLATVLARGSADGVAALAREGVPIMLLGAVTSYPWASMLHAAVYKCLKAALASHAQPYRMKAWMSAGLLLWVRDTWAEGNMADGCAPGSRGGPGRPRADATGAVSSDAAAAAAAGGNSPQRRRRSPTSAVGVSSSPSAAAATEDDGAITSVEEAAAAQATPEVQEERRQRAGGAGGVSRLRPAYMGHLVSIAVDVGGWLDRVRPPSPAPAAGAAPPAHWWPSEQEVTIFRELLSGAVCETVALQEQPLGEQQGDDDGGGTGGLLGSRQEEDDEDPVEETVEVIFDYLSGDGEEPVDVSDVVNSHSGGRSSSSRDATGDGRGRSVSSALAKALPDAADRKAASSGRGSSRRGVRHAAQSRASQSTAITELADDDEDIQTVDVEDVDPSTRDSMKTPPPPPSLPPPPPPFAADGRLPAPVSAPHMNGKIPGGASAAAVASATAAVAAMDLSSSDDDDEYVKFDPDADDFVDGDEEGDDGAGGAAKPATPDLDLPDESAPHPTRVSNFVADGAASSSDDDGEWEPFNPDDDEDDEAVGDSEATNGAVDGVAGVGAGSASSAPPPSPARRGVLPAIFSAVAAAATGGKPRQ